MISFTQLQNNRKKFLNDNKNKDFVVLEGGNKVILSVPHAVSQIRLGKYKYAEIGSLAVGLYLKDKTNSYLIAKTKNNNDDANFDIPSPYKNKIKSIIKENDIKYLIDIHGLAAKRQCDVNLGTHLGFNIQNNILAFDKLNNALTANGFTVFIDQPFMANDKTISTYIKKAIPNIFSLQIEINCSITNEIKNYKKYAKLLKILADWIVKLG